MASVSVSTERGVDGFKFSDFTSGTLAPNAGRFELRVNLVDGQGANVTRKDIIVALEAFRRYFENMQLQTTSPIL